MQLLNFIYVRTNDHAKLHSDSLLGYICQYVWYIYSYGLY